MAVPSSGDYSHGPVPTVFVEQTPPPIVEAHVKERSSGGGMGAGAMIMIVVLFIGMLIAGLGGAFYLYNGEHQKVAGLDTAKTKFEKDLAAANKALATEREKLAEANKTIENYKINYGKVEALQKTAAAESAKLEELLKRRPGAKVDPKYLQPLTWDGDALKKFNDHIAGIQKEFTRIDTQPAKVIDSTPKQPKIGGG